MERHRETQRDTERKREGERERGKKERLALLVDDGANFSEIFTYFLACIRKQQTMDLNSRSGGGGVVPYDGPYTIEFMQSLRRKPQSMLVPQNVPHMSFLQRACVRVRVCVCVCACVCACACVRVRACVRVCVFLIPRSWLLVFRCAIRRCTCKGEVTLWRQRRASVSASAVWLFAFPCRNRS